jgi:hypothetical protein
MKRPPNQRLVMMAASTLVMAAAFLQGLARFIH